MKQRINDFIKVLSKCWSAETSRYYDDRTPKSAGQCSVSAMLIQDYFGGEVRKIHVGKIAHFFNFIDGTIIDSTADQFDCEINYDNFITISPDFYEEETWQRYNILKERVDKIWK